MGTLKYDVIVIGAGSGGLTVGLFMAKTGFKVLMVSKSDQDIGGDCLNDGCVPSKALIHVAKIAHNAREASNFGLEVSGKINIKKATDYIFQRQEIIRKHENAEWLREQKVDVALGEARFSGKNEVEVAGKKFSAKKIVIATGSSPKKLKVSGVEKIEYYDNESIFNIEELPENLLVIGGGPIGIEISQAMSRLGSKVTVIQHGDSILENDNKDLTEILKIQLEKEGIDFIMNAKVEEFITANTALLKVNKSESKEVDFDGVFVAVGRELNLESLNLKSAGIEVRDNKIVKDQYLRTTNKNVYLCGDIAGDLMFSHAAEFHGRILLNNFFSPLKKKFDNKNMSWVTFTEPQLATFGFNEKQLKEKGLSYSKLQQDFKDDDRAVVGNYQYSKLVLYISKGGLFTKEKILGGSMVAPNAGDLIQELILANTSNLSINSIFNKIYPYPVASRINQQIITNYKEKSLTETVNKLLQTAFKIFS
ncbi:dihydrolipoyl dehydrogenase family protein [Halpernia sp. GG3]